MITVLKSKDAARKAAWNAQTLKGDPARLPNPFSTGFNEGWDAAERYYRATTKAETCPKCGGPIVSTAHGFYCPKDTCKWGWEVEMDGSPLKPPVGHSPAPAPQKEKS